MVSINCVFCKKEIKTYPSRIGRKKFCSHSCRAKAYPSVNFIDGHKWFGKLRAEKRKSSNDKYVEIYSPNHVNKNKRNTVLEHRLVMEKHIGRCLLDHEVVHHINRNSKDNRIENLYLCNDQREHMYLHFVEDALNNKVTFKNTTGLRGVTLSANKKRWVAKIGKNSGYVHVGVFDTKEEAYHAYIKAIQSII